MTFDEFHAAVRAIARGRYFSADMTAFGRGDNLRPNYAAACDDDDGTLRVVTMRHDPSEVLAELRKLVGEPEPAPATLRTGCAPECDGQGCPDGCDSTCADRRQPDRRGEDGER